jgi:hypothetical protein
VAKLLSPRRTPDYANELGRYTRDGRFVPAVVTRKGDVKDILRPARDRAGEFADALARAAARSPHLRSRLRHHDAAAIRGAIKDVALRTRPASSGSQGLEKYFVLMNRPLKDVEHDAILYFKQQVATAPERAGLIPPDPRDPGRRCTEDIELVSRPDHYLSDYVELGGKSYWVTVREPWTDELDPEDIKNYDNLLAYARIWGTATGSCHWLPDQRRVIAERTTPDLKVNLRRLSAAYVTELDRQYQAFVADPRVPALVRPAEAALLDAARR